MLTLFIIQVTIYRMNKVQYISVTLCMLAAKLLSSDNLCQQFVPTCSLKLSQYNTLTLYKLCNCSCFCCLIFFKINFFEKKNLSETLFSVSNGLDPDWGKRSVSPDLGSNCLQRLSAYHKRGTCIKGLFWPPLEPKTESCFLPISSYWFVRRIAKV